MEEHDLEESLNGYKTQLNQVSQLIPSADTMTKLELYDLEKDLKEMIKVTEESLLTLKKQSLMAMLSEETSCSSSKVPEQCIKTFGESTQAELLDEPVDDLDFVGTKCRVKYTQEWGSFQYHNAMVLSYDQDDDDDSIQVRVLFINPIHLSMVPCKYFLDGKCNYTDQDCRFSHGYIVPVNEIKEYEEPDFSKLSLGSKCLAKHDDNGVWYKATVSDIHDEQVTISFDTYKDTVTLDFHEIFPIMVNYDESSNSDSDTDDIEDADDGSTDISYRSVSMAGPMADWEEHTRGIGSKLMAKMGYIFGKGLGKSGQGRIEPVEIRLLPPGKSLDYVAELREKGKIKDPTKRKRVKTKNNGSNTTSQDKGTTKAAFDLINRLTHKGGQHKHITSSDVKKQFGLEDTYKSMKKNYSSKQKRDGRSQNTAHGKQKAKTSINVQMFQNSEKITALKKKLAKQKEALARNKGESTVSRTIKKNIEITQHELDELLKIDKSYQDQLNMKQQSKKLSIF